MPFTLQPNSLLSAYSTLEYKYEHTISGNSHPMAIEVVVTINGNDFRTFFQTVYESVTENSGDYTYVFSFDISKTVSSYFDNSLFFYQSGFSYPYSSQSLTADTTLKVYAYEPDLNGVLTKDSVPVISNTNKYFNTLRNDINDFVKGSGRRFMTTRSDKRLSYDFNNLLAVYSNKDANTVRVDVSGVVTYVSLVELRINILNLNDYFTSADSFLTLTLGTLDGVDFTTTGESLTYVIIDTFCESIALHFQNDLGTFENYIFKNYEYEILKARENEYYVDSDNKVKVYEGIVTEDIRISKQGFFNDDWDFVQGMVTSSLFYLEKESIITELYPTFNEIPIKTINGENDLSLSFSNSSDFKTYGN